MRSASRRRSTLRKAVGAMTSEIELRVRDVMVKKPVVFTTGMDLLDAVRILVDKQISGAPVIDERGNLVGVLSERDFLRAAVIAGYHGERGGRIEEYMTTEVEAVNANDSLLDVAAKFGETKYRRFPVIEDNRVVGIVARREVLRAVVDSFVPD